MKIQEIIKELNSKENEVANSENVFFNFYRTLMIYFLILNTG